MRTTIKLRLKRHLIHISQPPIILNHHFPNNSQQKQDQTPHHNRYVSLQLRSLNMSTMTTNIKNKIINETNKINVK